MSWLRRLRNTFRRKRLHGEIERELAFHLVERADQLRAEGLDPDEAMRRARLRFGNPLVQGERTRDVDVTGWLDALMRTVRYAIRANARRPGFAGTVIVTLAVGIGANTAVFSAIDAVLLQPLPVPESERLVRVLQVIEEETAIAPGRLEEWAQRTTALESLTGYYVEDVSDTTGELPERVRRAVIAPRFLQVWGIAPALGRDLTDAEYQVGGPPTVLISDHYWRTRFDADPNVLTRTVRIEGDAFAIAGVMPASFRLPDRTVDLWWPYPTDGPALRHTAQNRKHQWYTGVGRLKAGITPEQAQAHLLTVQAGLATEYPETDADIGVRVVPYTQTLIGDVRRSLWLLYGAVSVLLLIACTNIAALWLARAAHREQEVAVRFALGASRAAIIGQQLVETALLAAIGAGLGLVVAAGTATAIQAFVPDLPRREEIGIDARMLVYTVAAAVIVTLLCGGLPAIRSARAGEVLARGGRTQVGGRHRLQWLLVGVQVALSIMLLVGAGLLVRSVEALSRVDPGFDPSHVLALRVSANWGETANRDGLLRRVDRTLGALGALPGVEVAATAWSLPGVPRRFQTEFALVEGRAASDPPLLAEWRSVSPTYFGALRIPLSGGELCRSTNLPTSELMVNRSFADRYFRHGSIVGSHLSWEAASLTGRVVGIIADVRELGMDRAPAPTVYTCDSAPTPFPWFLVRTHGEPSTLAAAVRATVKELEPNRSVYDIKPLPDRIGDAYAHTRLRMSLLALFAITALSLACLGVYGTLSYAVSLRRREVSLRLALGALRREIIGQMVGQALRVVSIACVCGLLLSVVLRQALAGMLYGVSPTDPTTFVAVFAVVLGLGFLAALIPAARATLVEPMRVLREE